MRRRIGERKKAGEISHTKTAAVMKMHKMFDCGADFEVLSALILSPLVKVLHEKSL